MYDMKKLFCILMAITMLCSLMVVNASAANTYEGEGFKIVTDYEFECDSDTEEGGFYYIYHYNEYTIEVYVCDIYLVLDHDDDGLANLKELYDTYLEDTEGTDLYIDGIPADCLSDPGCYHISLLSDNYYYYIELRVAEDDLEADPPLEMKRFISENFQIEDSTDWYKLGDDYDYTSYETEEPDKTNSESKTDNNSESDKSDNTVIIVAIVVGGVVILGVTAMIIFGKKKKQ